MLHIVVGRQNHIAVPKFSLCCAARSSAADSIIQRRQAFLLSEGPLEVRKASRPQLSDAALFGHNEETATPTLHPPD